MHKISLESFLDIWMKPKKLYFKQLFLRRVQVYYKVVSYIKKSPSCFSNPMPSHEVGLNRRTGFSIFIFSLKQGPLNNRLHPDLDSFRAHFSGPRNSFFSAAGSGWIKGLTHSAMNRVKAMRRMIFDVSRFYFFIFWVIFLSSCTFTEINNVKKVSTKG